MLHLLQHKKNFAHELLVVQLFTGTKASLKMREGIVLPCRVVDGIAFD